ncbi:hypothetical protein OHA21_00235 [Actinoplanes sp. NBC_00393]|uniref:hypothetical protein n=1 Tax=Actinoplanes sp. NBC_00393 TaxID=2975953 RepID=UPI002E233BA5
MTPEAVGLGYLLLLAIAAVLHFRQPTFLPEWRPQDVGDAIGLAWQVQASLAAIGFAGLALIIQLATNTPVAVRSSREVLYRGTHFNLMVAVSASSSVVLGVVATWLQSDGGALLCFAFCFVGTLGVMGLSYLRAARLFLDDRRALDKAMQLLLRRLDDEVRDQRTASDVNRLLAQFFPQAGPVRRSRAVPSGRRTLQLVTVTDTRRVRDFDAAELRRVSVDLLRAVSGEQFRAGAAGTPAAAAPEPAILLIRHGVNDVVQPGEALFHLVVDEELEPDVVGRFDQRLRRCVSWAPDTTVDDELAGLKDSLLVSAHAGTSGALERGLRVYGDLFRRIMEIGGGRPDDFPFGTYGPYWRAIHRSLREVSAVAVDKLGDVGVVLISDNAYALCNVAFDAHDIGAMQEFLGLYPAYLRQVTAAPAGSSEYLLVSLQNLLDLRLATLTEDDFALRRSVEIVAAGAVADMLKVCVDAGNAPLVERVLAHFRYPALTRRLSREGREARTAAPLAALAWAFFRWRHDRQPAEMKAVSRELLKAFTGEDLWAAYERTVTSSEIDVPWERWEAERGLPWRFRFSEFSQFLGAAAVAVGSRAGMAVPEQDPTPEDGDRAAVLLDAFQLADELSEQLDLSAAGGQERLRASLSALVERRRNIDDTALRQAPLEEDRVKQFAAGFGEALTSAPYRLSDFLLADPSGDVTVDGTKLIFNSLVPRGYFVTNDRISAEPAELGRSLAAGLLDSENAYIVKTLIEGLDRTSADVEEIESRRDTPGSLVVVVNDYRLAARLALDSEEEGLYLDVDGVESFCLVCDLASAARLVRKPFSDERTGEPVHDLHDVALAVRDYEQPTGQPVAHLKIGTSLDWSGTPGSGIEVLVRTH